MIGNERCRPRGSLISVHLPQFMTVSFIQCCNERVALMIPVDDQCILVESNGTAFAKAIPSAHIT